MLRDYQQRAIHNVYEQWQSGHRETLLVAATGAGKTQMYLSIGMDALDIDPDARALVIAHRRELIEQPIERIKLMNAQWLLNGSIDRPRVGVITQGRCDTDRQLTVATVQSMNERRTTELLRHGAITHLITDEAHHVVAGGYLRLRSQLLEANPNLLHLGVTATPMRADGDGLRKVYTSVADRISIADLVRQGWLVKPRWLGVSTAVSLSGVHTRAGDYVASELADAVETESMRRLVVQSYQQYAAGRRFIGFTVTVDGAHKLAEAFVEAGLRVKAIDGTTPLEERASILSAYRKGELDGLTNCQVLTEGFDAPGTSCILMCRPTRSDGLYIQCLDMETEVLTHRGWMRYNNINQSDYVAGFDAQTSNVAWVPIEHIIKRAVAPDEQMFAIQSPTVDIRVTGGHRMLMRHRRSLDAAWRFVNAEDLAQKRSDYQIPVAGFQEAAGVPLSDDELRFIGLWLADGTINKKTRQVTIFQSAHQPQNVDIVNILNGCGFKYNMWEFSRETQYRATSAIRHYTIRRGRGIDALAHIDPYLDKNLSPAMEHLTSLQLGCVLEGLHIGDGLKERNVAWNRQTYHIITGNLTFAERLQSLCVRRGYRCNLATRAIPTGEAYTLHIKFDDRRAIGGASQGDRERFVAVPTRPDEHVWCVSNRLQTLIIRRNGKVSVVGNCMGRGLRPARGRAEPGEDCLILDFIPADARNIVMAGDVLGIPKEQAKAIRELAEDEAEEGAVQVGFTFDGERIDASGTPLEIVARQIDYLQASTLAWYPPRGTRGTDDILTVGLGRGRDNNERILAVRNEQLYGLIRYPQPDDTGRYGPWKVHHIEATDIYARAEAIAEKWGVETLMNRGTSWRGRMISEKQASYLARLARGHLKLAAIRLMTAGEAAQAITHYQALDALGRTDV